MKYLPLHIQVEEIKAESFLASFRDSFSNISAELQGVFSRNYNDDIIEIETDSESEQALKIVLSRDSLFHILPEGLFFNENRLKQIGKERNIAKFKWEEEKINKEKQRIKQFFHPFDHTYLKLRFELEKTLNAITTDRIRIIIAEFMDVFHIEVENPYVLKTVSLLPLASEIRGNKMVWREVLKIVFFPSKIDIRIKEKRNPSGKIRRLLKVIIQMEKLSSCEFKKRKKEVDIYAQFFYEWFLPVDLGIEFKIKDMQEKFILGKSITLDYNTYLK